MRLANTPATVIGVMPEDFGYPVNHDAWNAPGASRPYRGLEGGVINPIDALRQA